MGGFESDVVKEDMKVAGVREEDGDGWRLATPEGSRRKEKKW